MRRISADIFSRPTCHKNGPLPYTGPHQNRNRLDRNRVHTLRRQSGSPPHEFPISTIHPKQGAST